MTMTEILNYLNTLGGTPAVNEIAAKIADMRGILSVQFTHESEDHTDRYIHRRRIPLFTGYDEQIIAAAESIADELDQIKARESYYATFVVAQIEIADNNKEIPVFMAVYDYETVPEWKEVDANDEDHEFCSFYN